MQYVFLETGKQVFMNRILRIFCVSLGATALLTACVKEGESSTIERERLALQEWMEIYHPDLVENLQSEGGYYVDVEKLGDTESRPINDSACWVRFTFTGRNLAGDIVLTRSETDARQVGSYSKFTHYVPYYKYYSGEVANSQLMEGTYLAMRNPLTLGEAYAAERGYPREVLMRYGTKVTLYMPSTVTGGEVSGSGGYEGQEGYELQSGKPFIVTMEITDTVHNPIQREGSEVDDFAETNGGLKPVENTDNKAIALRRAAGASRSGSYDDGYRWRNAVDSIPQVYVDLTYKPTDRYVYPSVYPSIYAPYNNFDQLEQDIADTLVRRFGTYEGVETLQSDSVTYDGTAKIWYIGRFLDGFIFDTNIPGVRRLIYGETNPKGEALSVSPSSETWSYIDAWRYAIPVLRYGQWASIVTTSTSAYGSNGKAGSTTTTSSGSSSSLNDYYNWLSYYNYMNSYYGGGGYYDGYYNSYYNSYLYGMYYNNYNTNTSNSNSTTTTTTVETEIPPFTPLLFQVYVEPQDE